MIYDVMINVYSVALWFERRCSNERVIGFHRNFTRVLPYVGLFKSFPYLLAVVSGKFVTVLFSLRNVDQVWEQEKQPSPHLLCSIKLQSHCVWISKTYTKRSIHPCLKSQETLPD